MTALSPAVDVGIIGDIGFAERVQEGVDQNYTYHIERGLCDNLLLHHAHRAGAQVCIRVRRPPRSEIVVNVSRRRALLAIRLNGGSRTESSTSRLS